MGVYRDLKENLEKKLSQLAGLPELQGSNLARLIDKLRQNRFNLVVLGAFKRGKTTLINALLGEPLLPTAIIPLTSMVTILTYGERLTIEVLFHYGERRKISQPELVEYITEKGNPRNQKGVREVAITYPSEYLQDGVRVIDTPGVGSVYCHNTEVAYNYLPRWMRPFLWSPWTRRSRLRSRSFSRISGSMSISYSLFLIKSIMWTRLSARRL